ncbi:MAG: potassium efflux system protein, partial [Paracoccaceae bacterium]
MSGSSWRSARSGVFTVVAVLLGSFLGGSETALGQGPQDAGAPAAEPGPSITLKLKAESAAARASAARFREMIEAAPALRASLEKSQAEEQQQLVDLGGQTASLSIPEGLTSSEAEAGLAEARAKAKVAAGAVDDLDGEAAKRDRRQEVLPAEIAQAEEALKQAREKLGAAVSAATSVAASERREELDAEVERAEAIFTSKQAEQKAYQAQEDVLALQRDAAVRRRKVTKAAVTTWDLAMVAAGQREAEQARKDAVVQFTDTLKRYPTLQKIAAQNRDLAQVRSGPNGAPSSLLNAAKSIREMRELLEETQRRRNLAERRKRTGALTEGMAAKLRRDFEWLPSTADLKAAAASLDQRLTDAEIREINLEEDQILDPEARVQEMLAARQESGLGPPEEGWTEAALNLLQQQREMQADALDKVGQLQKRLYEARLLRQQAREAIEEYRSFIEARIVWVRSAALNPLSMVTDAPEAGLEIVKAARECLKIAAPHREAVLGIPPLASLVATLLALVWLASRRFLGRKLKEMSEATRSYRTDRFSLTVRGLLQSLLLAAPWPLIMWALGRWFGSDHAPSLVRSAGSALCEVAWLFGVLRFALVMLRTGGVGTAHFRWRADSAEHTRKHLRWYTPCAVVSALVALLLDRHGVQMWSDSIGRLAFLLWMVSTALFVRWSIGPDSPIWEPKKREDDDEGFLLRTRQIWLILAVGLPVLLAALALTGYYYTALQFELRIRTSAYFLLGLLTVYSMLLRWLYISRRKLAVAQALEARERRKKATESEAEGTPGPLVDVDHVDIPSVDAQTRQLFKSSMTLTSVLGLYLIWTSALPALQQLNRIQLLPRLAIVSEEESSMQPAIGLPSASFESVESSGPKKASEAEAVRRDAVAGEVGRAAASESSEAEATSSSPAAGITPQLPASGGGDSAEPVLLKTLTLGDVLLALIFLALTNVAVRNLPALLELALLQRLPLDSGARYAITTILRYLILVVGVTAVSGAVGIGWRQVQWLAAALTFGLAFGLQEIFANFVSGLIILIERPVRVGDIVTVGGTEGRVTQLRMRATTILDWDRRE